MKLVMMGTISLRMLGQIYSQGGFLFPWLSLPLYIMKISIAGRHDEGERCVSWMQPLLTSLGIGEGAL